MKCPECGGSLWTYESRTSKKLNQNRRRKECKKCLKRITTQEIIVMTDSHSPHIKFYSKKHKFNP